MAIDVVCFKRRPSKNVRIGNLSYCSIYKIVILVGKDARVS